MIRSAPLAAALTLCLVGCGGADRSANQSDAIQDRGGNAVDQASTLTKLELTSSAFRDGQPIPRQYSCDGASEAPALKWGEPPAGTRSFAIVIDDPDAPSGTFRHWGVFDIPASARSIGGPEKAGIEVKNDKGSVGYTGPCPPPGNGVHHYHFRLFALPVEKLGIDATTAKVADVEAAASKKALATGELIGTYERK